MRVILIAALLSFGSLLQAQTKKIAHRSHSGTDERFLNFIETDNDADHSNFGMAPEPLVVTAKLDSVILISDSVAVMVTSEYCRRKRSHTDLLWKAGKDTVIHHPVFSNHLSVEEMREILRTNYHFRNPADSVVFIGYEEPITLASPHRAMDTMLFKIPAMIVLLSALGGWLSWKIMA
jgi:hypothetical protein